MKKEKRIPTILGLLFLIGAVFGGIYLTNQNTNPVSKASGTCDPINPQITNITYNSANISFTTSSECLSNISINNKNFENLKLKSKIHYFEITNLKESNSYQFTIISDGKNYTSDSFSFQTAVKPNKTIPSSNLAWGRVFTPEGQSASDAIVYLNIPGGSPLSALITTSGNWNISLSTSFNESLTDWFTPPANIEENLVVLSPGYDQTQIVSNTSRNNPVPDITLGQNNFSSPQNLEPSSESLIKTETDLTTQHPLTITNPSDNETLSSQKPDFFGTGPSKTKISVKVESDPVYTDTITVNDDGSWNWSPPQNLAPGEHTITVTTSDNKTVSKKFIVLAAESSQPAFSSSPSASTPTPTPSKKLTITPTVKVTNTPTITKVKTTNPSTASGVPQTGTTLPTLILIILSICSVGFAYVYHKKS